MLKLLYFLLFLSFILSHGCQNAALKANEGLSHRLQILHDPNSDQVLVVAHRALHTKYPENSLAAIRHSIDIGIDMIEIDVRQTADGVLVLMHDASVQRTTDGKGQVNELTYREIKNLHLKNSSDYNQTHPVPSLQAVLELTKDKILVDIDIKEAPVKKLVELVRSTRTTDQVLFFQHHNITHDSILVVDENLMIAPRAETAGQVFEFLNRYQPVVIQIPPEIADPALISQMQMAGCRAWINALGDADNLAENGQIEEAFSPLVEMGARVIQSDRPDLLLRYLQEIGRHW